MALNALGIDTKASDFIWIHVLSEKLDSETAKEWQLTNVDGKLQSMDSLRKFLELRARALEASGGTSEQKREPMKENRNGNEKPDDAFQSYQSTSVSCAFFKQSLRIYVCSKLLALPVAEMYEQIKKLRLCFNCLKDGHGIKACKSKSSCQKCKKKHHSLLHRDEFNSPKFSSNGVTSDEPNFTGNQGEANYTTLSPTAIVSVVNSHNELVQCRALLDCGSQLSFVTQRSAKQLNLNQTKVQLNLSGIGGKVNDVKAGRLDLVLKANSKQVNVSAFILKQLTNCIPSRFVVVSDIPDRFPLADPDFHLAKSIDIILGADVFKELIENQREELSPGLFLSKTIFGWIILGKQPGKTDGLALCHFSLDETVRKFWEIESLPQSKLLSDEEVACEEHFKETTTVVDIRFVVKLPFKKDVDSGDSFAQAKQRFDSLERRLNRDPTLRQKYAAFIIEFLALDHMEIIPESEIVKPPMKFIIWHITAYSKRIPPQPN